MIVQLLVGSLGLAPGVATVVAAVLIKRVLAPTLEETCSGWGQHLAAPLITQQSGDSAAASDSQ